MHGTIMWNTTGFMDTEVSKSQLVNMAINKVFFSGTLLEDGAGLLHHPNHIKSEKLDPKRRHIVVAAFTVKGLPVEITFDYDYFSGELKTTTKVEDDLLGSHGNTFHHTNTKGEISIDGLLNELVKRGGFMNIGQANATDWLLEEAESFPVLPEAISGMTGRIGNDSFFLSQVKAYADTLTGDDVYIGNLNWMQNSMNWWQLSQVVERTLMFAQGNTDRITSMKPQVQRALDAYNESNNKGVGRSGMEANSGVILSLTEFILSYKPEK